jgi:hypothetical protein
MRQDLVRRLLHAARVCLAWQPVWWTVWALFLTPLYVLRPAAVGPGEGFVLLRVFGGIGLVSGAIFASVRAFGGGASVPRAAMWGVPAGALAPLLLGKPDQALLFGLVGGVTGLAVATLSRGSLAR